MILRQFILFLILFSPMVHAEFEFVTTNEDLDEIYFIDLSTLDILKNDHKTVQVLINYQNGFITNNSSVAFSALEERSRKTSMTAPKIRLRIILLNITQKQMLAGIWFTRMMSCLNLLLILIAPSTALKKKSVINIFFIKIQKGQHRSPT